MKWINAKERKPTPGLEVLVTDQVNVWLGDYNPRTKEWAVVYNGAPPVESSNITHWMEKPHPIHGFWYEKVVLS